MVDTEDDPPLVEVLSAPLTRPSMYFGVDITVFVINGSLGIVLYIASSNILMGAICLPVHFAFAYLCQHDMNIVRVMMTWTSLKKPIRNISFWKARSYAP